MPTHPGHDTAVSCRVAHGARRTTHTCRRRLPHRCKFPPSGTTADAASRPRRCRTGTPLAPPRSGQPTRRKPFCRNAAPLERRSLCVCRIGATPGGFCAVLPPLPCLIVRALCRKPPPYAISRKNGFRRRIAFSPPCQNPGFRRGFPAFFGIYEAFPGFQNGKPFICDPTDIKVAARPSRWFHSVLPGGFDRKSVKTSSRRLPGMTFSTLPNYFSEIVAKMFLPVLK